MNSFFFTQLSDNGKGYRYAGVKRFLKKAKVNPFVQEELGVFRAGGVLYCGGRVAVGAILFHDIEVIG